MGADGSSMDAKLIGFMVAEKNNSRQGFLHETLLLIRLTGV